jgi:hypothetical protein
MLFIPDVSVKKLFMPEAAVMSQQIIATMGGNAFPVSNDATHFVTGRGCEQRMYVIRHHTPGVQPVLLGIEMKQRILNDLSQPAIAQPAIPMSGIQKVLYPSAEFNIGACLFQMLQLFAPTVEHGLRH